MKNELTIITVNYFSSDLINDLSKKLPRNNKVKYSWVVVDNSNNQQEFEKLQKMKKVNEIINPKKNLGFGSANNLAAKGVKTKYILFLNPDTDASKLDLGALVTEMELNNDIKMIGPKILNADGTLQISASNKYPNWWSHKIDYSPMLRILIGKLGFNDYPILLSKKEHKNSRQVLSLLGACMLMRTADFKSLGGFDEDYFMYREETDLSKRIINNNGKIYYISGTSIVHMSGGASKNDFFAELNSEYTKSEYIFISKWHNFVYVSFCWIIGWLSTFLSIIIFALAGLIMSKKRKDYFRIMKLSLGCFIQHSLHPFAIGYYRKHK
jgi:GT2 family glycosyltransferase